LASVSPPAPHPKPSTELGGSTTTRLPAGPETRRRLLDGMTRAVARHGYVEASVVQAAEYGGVARARFYEHFADKEDCFRAAFRDVAGRAAAALHEALDQATAGGAAQADLRRLLFVLLNAVERDPDGARLMLIEALASGAHVRAERQRLIGEAERAIERLLGLGLAGRPSLDISARAVLGGVLGVISMRLLRGEAMDLERSLLDDLLAWIGSYTVPAGQPRRSSADWSQIGRGLAELAEPPAAQHGSPAPQRAPRARAKLSAEEAREESRQRILIGVARAARLKGYAAVTIADIVAAAQISRSVFYAHFHSKHEAFLASQALAAQGAMAAYSAAFMTAPPLWIERVWAGGVAFGNAAAGVRSLAHAAAIEVYAAGSSAIELRNGHQLAFTLFIEDGYRQRIEAEALPRLCSEAIASAIVEMGYDYVAGDRVRSLPELVPEGVYVALAPFIGAVEARAFVEEKVRAARAAGEAKWR
jgi:AcrR family transcriptional regulator